MNCEETIEFYIRDTKFRMEQVYLQATGKELEWGTRDEYMRKMYNLQNCAEGFLALEHDLQMFLEMKNRIKLSSETGD